MAKKRQLKSSLIQQTNVLIMGNQSISQAAKVILLFGATKIDAHSEEPNKVRIKFSEFQDFLDRRVADDWNSKTALVNEIFHNLGKNPLEASIINEETGKEIYIFQNWLQSLDLESSPAEEEEELVIVYTDRVRIFFVSLQSQSDNKLIDWHEYGKNN